VFLIIDRNGNYTVGTTKEFAEGAYESDVGGGAARRHILVNVTASLRSRPRTMRR